MKYFFAALFFAALYTACTPSQASNKKTTPASFAAELPCKGDRYKKDIFKELTISKNVPYNSGKNLQNQKVKLSMDIFEPEDDKAELRPLVIWAHGGYFVFGDKSNFHQLCEFVSQKGWVSASIDYRKWRKRELPDSLQYLEVAIRATHDMHAAIRFFKADAAGPNKYKIDTTKIFVGGYSAGGIMAAQVAYLDDINEVPSHIQAILNRNGGITGNGWNQGHSSDIAGSIVIAGGVYNKSIIQQGAHPPFLGIQGTQDEVVPFARGWAKSPMGTKVAELDGTSSIHKTNTALGHPSTLLTLPRGDHGAPWDELFYERTGQYIHNFLMKQTCE